MKRMRDEEDARDLVIERPSVRRLTGDAIEKARLEADKLSHFSSALHSQLFELQGRREREDVITTAAILRGAAAAMHSTAAVLDAQAGFLDAVATLRLLGGDG